MGPRTDMAARPRPAATMKRAQARSGGGGNGVAIPPARCGVRCRPIGKWPWSPRWPDPLEAPAGSPNGLFRSPQKHLRDSAAAQGLRHCAELSGPCRSIAEVEKAMRDLERSLELDAPKAKHTRSIAKQGGEAMMFQLHFHYEDVLRQDLLLKLNHTNIMEIPGLFEIRLVPKTASDFKPQIGKLAMDILCSQRFIQTQGSPAGKSSRSNPFFGADKDTASGFL